MMSDDSLFYRMLQNRHSYSLAKPPIAAAAEEIAKIKQVRAIQREIDSAVRDVLALAPKAAWPAETELQLTEYDKKLLQGMKVKA